MIARWTGVIPQNIVSNHAWAHWDMLPTLAEIAGAYVPIKVDGVSMFRALRGMPQPTHDYFYWEHHEGGFQQAARMGKWKAVRKKYGKPVELYDLESDPEEKRDVASANTVIIEKIESYLVKARTDSPNWPIR